MHTYDLPLLGLMADWLVEGEPEPPATRAAAGAVGPRLFVVEDDPVFARLLRQAAERSGASLDVFDPDRDFHRLPRDGDYDAGIVDYNLGVLSGAQIAALYAETPVILTSISPEATLADEPWPRSVRAFLCKRQGVRTLIETGIKIATAPTVA